MKKQCAVCGKEFQVKPSHYDKRTYCSRACLSEGYKTKLRGEGNPHYSNASHRVCQHCGKEFSSYQKTRRYCSRQCYSAANGRSEENLNRLKKMSTMPRKARVKTGRRQICKACGVLFLAKNHRWYCPKCTMHGMKTMRNCVICGKLFQHNANKKTCSDECLSIHRSLIQQGEKSHLWQGGKTPFHQAIRKIPGYKLWRSRVFQRDDYTCQICLTRGGKLAAHHIRLFSTHPNLRTNTGNGITLCWQCHASIKGKEAYYEDAFIEVTGGIRP